MLEYLFNIKSICICRIRSQNSPSTGRISVFSILRHHPSFIIGSRICNSFLLYRTSWQIPWQILTYLMFIAKIRCRIEYCNLFDILHTKSCRNIITDDRYTDYGSQIIKGIFVISLSYILKQQKISILSSRNRKSRNSCHTSQRYLWLNHKNTLYILRNTKYIIYLLLEKKKNIYI